MKHLAVLLAAAALVAAFFVPAQAQAPPDFNYHVAYALPQHQTYHVLEGEILVWSEQWAAVGTAATDTQRVHEFWAGVGGRWRMVRRVSRLPFDIDLTLGAITRVDGVPFDLPVGWYFSAGFRLDEPECEVVYLLYDWREAAA